MVSKMVVGIKDGAKLIGISIIACCAVLVCTMFLNFYFDVLLIENKISSEPAMLFYQAQVSTAKVVCLVSGGCLLMTSVVMLFFYCKHYIDTHKKELGILKALGYSNLKIAKGFRIFGISVLIGALPGFCGAFLLMPLFYELQNKDKILPEIVIQFHPVILLYFVVLPTIGFAVLAVAYAFFQLKAPVLLLLKDGQQLRVKAGKPHAEKARAEKAKTEKTKPTKVKTDRDEDLPFLTDLRKHTLWEKKILLFFITFASFCFSSMTQMSAGMKELASVMMGIMMLIIGMILACTTLFLAIATVIKGNTKTIAMMRVFGYSRKECTGALLGVYRPMAYVGFALGTGYQYGLLRLMVDVVFRDIEGMPVYEFDFPMMLLSLVLFTIFYETVMYCFSDKIRKISVKEIMLE